MLNRIILFLIIPIVGYSQMAPERVALYYSSRTPHSDRKMLDDYEWSLELIHPFYTLDLDYERELGKYFVEYKITGVWKPAPRMGISGKAIRKIVEYQTIDLYMELRGLKIGVSAIRQDNIKKTLYLGYSSSIEYRHIKFEAVANAKSDNVDLWWNLSLKGIVPITGHWDFVVKRVIDVTPSREFKSAKIGVEYQGKKRG